LIPPSRYSEPKWFLAVSEIPAREWGLRTDALIR